jgi:hypothetical protein
LGGWVEPAVAGGKIAGIGVARRNTFPRSPMATRGATRARSEAESARGVTTAAIR